LPVAKSEIPETTAVYRQVFASDFATRDQSEAISDGYRWRRWESNGRLFAPFRRFSNGFADRYPPRHRQPTRTKRVSGHSYDNVTNTRCESGARRGVCVARVVRCRETRAGEGVTPRPPPDGWRVARVVPRYDVYRRTLTVGLFVALRPVKREGR
jgi:hypothetical protein